MLDYREHANMRSVYNTPPVFAIYITMLVLRWLRKEIGGLEAMDAMNQAKAAALYSALDASHNFYRGHAAVRDRSLMNAAFQLPTVGLEQSFLEQAKNHGLYGLAGHRSIGGIRASLYNAVTIEAVMNLCAFMENFQQQHGRESELNESASMKAAL
jgi:phosphoserine aminotransferase